MCHTESLQHNHEGQLTAADRQRRQQDAAEQAAVQEGLAAETALSVADKDGGCMHGREHKTEGSPAGGRTGQGSPAATGDGRIKVQPLSEVVLVTQSPACCRPALQPACC